MLGTLVAGVLEALRLSGRLEWQVYDVLTREYEQDNPAGYALYAVSMAAVVNCSTTFTGTSPARFSATSAKFE